jgi:hypothetical protein
MPTKNISEETANQHPAATLPTSTEVDEILIRYRNQYAAGDSLALLEAVRSTWCFSRPVPEWAHKALASICDSYLESEGREDLRRLFGLKWGQGRSLSPFAKKNQREKEEHIIGKMQVLNKYLGFSLPVAALVLEAKGVSYAKTNGERDSASPSEGYILDLYKNSPKPKIEDITAILEDTREARIDYFFDEFASAFTTLYEGGAFQEAGLLESAKRSLHKLLA